MKSLMAPRTAAGLILAHGMSRPGDLSRDPPDDQLLPQDCGRMMADRGEAPEKGPSSSPRPRNGGEGRVRGWRFSAKSIDDMRGRPPHPGPLPPSGGEGEKGRGR